MLYFDTGCAPAGPMSPVFGLSSTGILIIIAGVGYFYSGISLLLSVEGLNHWKKMYKI